jgi:hypothetical protein
MDATQNPSYQASLLERLNIAIFKLVNKHIPWHKLPTIIGAMNLEALRVELRQKNLHDGYATAAPQGTASSEPLPDERHKNTRHSDGKYNSLEFPNMSCVGMRFGRNFARKYTPKPTDKELWTPNPRMLSETFMTRKEFIPATTLNLLAAAWIQFQTHDWFQHDTNKKIYDIPLLEGNVWPHGKMSVFHTKPDDVLHPSDEVCPGYKNSSTPWWDGSQIYGSSEKDTEALRANAEGGKLQLTKDKREQFLPRDDAGNVKTGFNDNWWIGLEILHTLFALEHNSLCDMLHKAYPSLKA